MKIGKPLLFTPIYYADIEAEIARFFKSEIFAPLAKSLILPLDEITNEKDDKDPVLHAVKEGYLYYDNGAFRGGFNSKISKRLKDLGAKFSVRDSSWVIARGKIPAEILTAQAQADDRFHKLKDSLVKTIDGLDIDQQFEKYGFTEKYERALERMDEKFTESVASITIAPRLSAEQKEFIAHEWSQNLRLYVKDWSAQSILELRRDVQENAFAGLRSENMIKMIQGRYGVSQRKAEFLARQETSLLMSKFRESRYRDVGVDDYIWSGQNDGRERPDHVLLNGTEQKFSDPPITNRKTGATNNPGADYGCRCTARPLFK